MGHSQADKAQSHDRILNIAAAQIRESGLESLTVGSLMNAANLTHGGFYGHFASKSDLVVAALARALDQAAEQRVQRSKAAPATYETLVKGYLSEGHRDRRSDGCPFASLAADVARSDDERVRELMAERLDQVFARTAEMMEAEWADAAAAWSTMLGALLLARVLGPGEKSDALLAAARDAALGAQEAAGPSPP